MSLLKESRSEKKVCMTFPCCVHAGGRDYIFSAETICSGRCVHAKFSAKAHAQCCGYAIVKGFSGGPGRVPIDLKLTSG